MDLFTVAVMVTVVATGAFVVDRMALARRRPTPQAPPAPLDVAMLDLALPAATLAEIQAESLALSPARFAERVARLAERLQRAAPSWTHVGVRSFAPAVPAEADARYGALVREATGRLTLDVLPSGEGYRGEGDTEAPRVSVVTLLVVSRSVLPETPPASREAAQLLLDALIDGAASIESGLVVWLPERAAEGLRSDELATRAPRMVALSPTS